MTRFSYYVKCVTHSLLLFYWAKTNNNNYCTTKSIIKQSKSYYSWSVDPTNCRLVYVLFAQEILQPFYCKSQDPLVVVAVTEKTKNVKHNW